jgi:hypothetical protein
MTTNKLPEELRNSLGMKLMEANIASLEKSLERVKNGYSSGMFENKPQEVIVAGRPPQTEAPLAVDNGPLLSEVIPQLIEFMTNDVKRHWDGNTLV